MGLRLVQAQPFELRTFSTGFGSLAGSNGVAVADYNRDGHLDVYFVVPASYDAGNTQTWNRLFAGLGNGRFMDQTRQARVAGEDVGTLSNPGGMGNKLGASWGDYDNDGWPDLYLTHAGPNQLFHNNGDGTFTDVTTQAGVAGGATQISSSALWFDYDNDGDLDLYVSNWADHTETERDKSNWLYENLGDGVFQNVSDASGLADGGITWTTVALDVNNDGLLDLYLANDFGFNKLYVNNGNKTFHEATAAFGLEDRFHGMGLAVADCDDNGFLDLYLTNISDPGFPDEINPLFLNTGADVFTQGATEAGVAVAGWGWGTEFFDLENDGDEDLFVVTGNFESNYPNVLFRSGSETGHFEFEDITSEMGLADLDPARGLAVFDYDEDGKLDLLISNLFRSPYLYQNRLDVGSWLRVKLEGTLSNRDGFGAVVEVEYAERTHKKYHHGAQYLGQNILPVHFGLGEAQAVERIVVRWPSGHEDVVGPVAANQQILIRETEGLVGGQSTSMEEPAVPGTLGRVSAYPNPFTDETQIHFDLERPGDVEVHIVNVVGQTVQILRQFFGSTGGQVIRWNAANQKAPLGAGPYFYRIRVNGTVAGTGILLHVK